MLSSHLFFCLPCLLPPFTVPCKMVLARPDERKTWPYHCSLRPFMVVRRFSCGQIACCSHRNHRSLCICRPFLVNSSSHIDFAVSFSHTHTHQHTHTHTHTHTRTHTHRHTHARTHTDTDTDRHTQRHTHARAHTHTQRQTDTQTHTHAHTHTQTQTHTETHAHTHTTHTHTIHEKFWKKCRWMDREGRN